MTWQAFNSITVKKKRTVNDASSAYAVMFGSIVMSP